MNATDLLRDDHETIRELLETLRSARDKEEVLAKVEKEIRIHSQLEEELFYPAVREVDNLWVDAAVDAHQQIDELLEDLIDAVEEEAEFEQKLTELEEQLHAHIDDEETKLFPEVEAQLEELNELGNDLSQMRRDLEEEWREAA
ncbi:MAG: hemerythrin domain-containing protein [Candidatus Manganitrophus sp.]|nr:hemerythrin domain-containing protein [Candidatus Manganitrophus sp.]